MPERLARTDAYTQIKEAIGSGPFKADVIGAMSKGVLV
jgi:hypothetical protein